MRSIQHGLRVKLGPALDPVRDQLELAVVDSVHEDHAAFVAAIGIAPLLDDVPSSGQKEREQRDGATTDESCPTRTRGFSVAGRSTMDVPISCGPHEAGTVLDGLQYGSRVPRAISNSESGRRAEEFVVEQVRCPSCDERLERYGGNRPLRDVLCSRCDFQAQVKSIHVAARSRIRGAGRRMMGLKEAGGIVPPHFFVWEWNAQARTAGAVDFVPFLPWESLVFRVLPDTMSRRTDRGKIRVEYTRVLSLPRLRVYGT